MISAGTARCCERTLSHFAGIGMCPTSSFCNVASHLPCLLKLYLVWSKHQYSDKCIVAAQTAFCITLCHVLGAELFCQEKTVFGETKFIPALSLEPL